LVYEGGFWLIKRAALGRLSFKAMEKKGYYTATLQGETLGVVGWLTRYRVDTYRSVMEEIDGEIQALTLDLTEIDCEMDRIRARIHDQRRALAEKLAQLEPLAHRTSTQNHLNMMLARVEGLEAYLLGKKDVPPESYDLHYKRHTNASGDLLYLRVRLLTTRIALIAANYSRKLSEFDTMMARSLIEVEQLKSELATLAARIECMCELSRYWLMYFEIVVEKAD